MSPHHIEHETIFHSRGEQQSQTTPNSVYRILNFVGRPPDLASLPLDEATFNNQSQLLEQHFRHVNNLQNKI